MFPEAGGRADLFLLFRPENLPPSPASLDESS
jgi:hypothetical protein